MTDQAAPVQGRPRMLRRREVLAYLDCSSSTLYRWIDDGLIPRPLPGTTRWDRAAIDAALDRLSGIKNGTPHADQFAARRDAFEAAGRQRAQDRP